ncbi:cupin domain-containing protein [Steroidobacter sp. S1-65]|uniref:Cupin domain-containing protein n=1 Tax=Steroidobacter gossypii TaxID=2805490 RepID=A0ABS1X0B5_9GAMM|nr:cupin domain-containing protein [Steroidobacter gossypii]MBM0106656.1 cupin domain-containing protein [Steroidobacter gossypii]
MRMFDRSTVQLTCVLAGTLIFGSGAFAQQASQRPQPIVAWSAQPVQANEWTAPHKPHWKLSEVLAKHSGERSWQEDIVSDRDFVARYISMAPGEKTKRQFFADDRVFWIVQSGRMRVSIDGQEPFVASRGFMVQVPYRIPYSIETVGSEPSLRFEVTGAQAVPLFPLEETPTPVAGKKYVKVSFTGSGAYDEVNKPYLDFNKAVVAANGRGGPFVKDDKTFANIIRGPGSAPPPASNLGHFHVGYSEFWLVLEGKIDYQIEGVPFFTAEPGDVVYAPQGRWHRASWGGNGMATRLAINPRPEGMHNFQPPEAH